VRIFLDIGAHNGHTVDAVAGMDFDQIFSFEPMPEQFAELERRFGHLPNVTLLPFGLSDVTGKRSLYGSNANLEASVYPPGDTVDESIVTRCHFVSASEWFEANLTDDDEVFAKINCEGSEVDILNDLVESGEIWKIHAVTICFDVQNIPGQEHREWETRQAMEEIGFNVGRWHLFGAAKGPTHKDRILDWMATV